MSLYALSALLNLITSFTLGIFVLRAKGDPINRAWFYFTFSVGAFSLGQFMREMVSTESSAFFWGGHVLFTSVVAIYITYPFFIHSITYRTTSRLVRTIYLMVMGTLIYLINWTQLIIRPEMRPKGVFHFYSIPGPLYPMVTSAYLMVVIYGLVRLFQRYRQSRSDRERRQMIYLILAFIIGFGGGAMNFLVDLNINLFPFGNYFIPAYTAVVSYAIVKHRLMDITVIIRKTLVYSVVMGSLAIVYISMVAIFAKVFEGFTGYQTVFSPALVAFLFAFCFQPLRKRVQAFVDSKFFRQYVDREEKLYELSREVITHTTPEAMGAALMRVLGESFHPKSAALYLRSRDGAGFTPVAFQGQIAPESMAEENPLSKYFTDHSQPFVQDLPSETGAPQSTRKASHIGRGSREAA